jgi:serine protease SohB
MFLAKLVTVVVFLLVSFAGINLIFSRGRSRRREEHLEIRHLNRKFEDMALSLKSAILPQREFKHALKRLKDQHKQDKKTGGGSRAGQARKKRVFVLKFKGDILASAVAELREEITAVLLVATPEDEVVVLLESAGGIVHSYGLAASQLLRIRQKNITLTVAVDRMAASGGYMMACVADRIIAAPFAIVGSIGVVAQLPNFNRLLKNHDIDYELITAGEYKRTLTMFGEITEKGRAKFREEIEDLYALFKDFIRDNRSQIDIDRIATGEYWHGVRALELKLVDELRTSDDYLREASEAADLYEVSYRRRRSPLERLTSPFAYTRPKAWRS